MISHFQFKLISKQALSILKVLRGNASEVLVTNGKQLCTEIIDICATVLNIFSKKWFLTTPNVENKFLRSYETFESTGDMKPMMKHYLCLRNSSELWIISSSSHGNLFWWYFKQMFTFFSFLRKCKNDCNILKTCCGTRFRPTLNWNCASSYRISS